MPPSSIEFCLHGPVSRSDTRYSVRTRRFRLMEVGFLRFDIDLCESVPSTFFMLNSRDMIRLICEVVIDYNLQDLFTARMIRRKVSPERVWKRQIFVQEKSTSLSFQKDFSRAERKLNRFMGNRKWKSVQWNTTSVFIKRCLVGIVGRVGRRRYTQQL